MLRVTDVITELISRWVGTLTSVSSTSDAKYHEIMGAYKSLIPSGRMIETYVKQVNYKTKEYVQSIVDTYPTYTLDRIVEYLEEDYSNEIEYEYKYISWSIRQNYGVVGSYLYPSHIMPKDMYYPLLKEVPNPLPPVPPHQLTMWLRTPCVVTVDEYYAQLFREGIATIVAESPVKRNTLMLDISDLLKYPVYVTYLTTINSILNHYFSGNKELSTYTDITTILSYLEDTAEPIHTTSPSYKQVDYKARGSYRKDTNPVKEQTRMEQVVAEYTGNKDYYTQCGINTLQVVPDKNILSLTLQLKLKGLYIVTHYYVKAIRPNGQVLYADINKSLTMGEYLQHISKVIWSSENQHYGQQLPKSSLDGIYRLLLHLSLK